jgi:hypothetical protein
VVGHHAKIAVGLMGEEGGTARVGARCLTPTFSRECFASAKRRVERVKRLSARRCGEQKEGE